MKAVRVLMMVTRISPCLREVGQMGIWPFTELVLCATTKRANFSRDALFLAGGPFFHGHIHPPLPLVALNEVCPREGLTKSYQFGILYNRRG